MARLIRIQHHRCCTSAASKQHLRKLAVYLHILWLPDYSLVSRGISLGFPLSVRQSVKRGLAKHDVINGRLKNCCGKDHQPHFFFELTCMYPIAFYSVPTLLVQVCRGAGRHCLRSRTPGCETSSHCPEPAPTEPGLQGLVVLEGQHYLVCLQAARLS